MYYEIVYSSIFIILIWYVNANKKNNKEHSIFWNEYTNHDMLNVINHIEHQLKIYVYPIPTNANKYVNKSTDLDKTILRHFKSEFIFRDYLKKLVQSKNHLVVSDPSQANVYFIDHDWARLFSNQKCNIIYTEYLPSIINNVVDNYPYYNRSNGKDHFFMAVYDKGPFCDPFCSPYVDTTIFKRIENAVYIGNYGMNKNHYMSHKYDNPVSNECHRAGYDIVIPQLIKNTTLNFHKVFYKDMYTYREYDSTFVGTVRGERGPLNDMCNNNSIDYVNKKTEYLECFLYYMNSSNFVFGHLDLLYNGYFSYNPCGEACWSQRLYESMTYYTIPIIITDGGLQAFEKFINWKKLTVKMSLTTWYNSTLRNQYRQMIRYESEVYRNHTNKCMDRYNKQWYNTLSYKKYAKDDFNYLSIYCPDLKHTFIYNKIKYYHQLVKWVDFNNIHTSMNAFKLLELEIYCRIKSMNESISIQSSSKYISLNDLCDRPSDYTADLEYFY